MESNTKYVGVSPFFLFFIVLFVLKLTNTIDLSWWVVTLPLWIGIPIFFIILAVLLIVGLIIKIKELFD